MASWRGIVSKQRVSRLDAETGAATARNPRFASNAPGPASGKKYKRGVPGNILSLCFCFLFLPISLRVLKYAVRRAKQEGTLTPY